MCSAVGLTLVVRNFSSSVRGLKKFAALLATPFRPPEGKPPFVLPCDKRSKNASAFFGLGPQRNRNQRKRIHFHCSRRFDTSQPFGSRPVRMSCIRALPFTYRHLAPVGAGPNAPFRSIRVAGRFAPPQGRCKPECFLSIRRRALRLSVASSPDKTPPSPLNEGLLLSGKKQSAVSNKVEETTLFRHDLAATLQESGRKIRSSSKMQGSSCPRCFGKQLFAEAHFAVDGCEKSRCFSLPSGARR